jgi:hypothetical protein
MRWADSSIEGVWPGQRRETDWRTVTGGDGRWREDVSYDERVVLASSKAMRAAQTQVNGRA